MTIDAPCPNCGTIYTVRRELIGKRTKCTRCGTPFTITEMPAPQAPAASAPPSPEQSPIPDIPLHQLHTPRATAPEDPAIHPRSAPHSSAGEFFGFEQDKLRPRFPALRMVARAYEIMALIVLIIGACLLIVFVVAVVQQPSAIVAAIISSGMGFFTAIATALMFLFVSQAIRLGLQIEQNTRETQQACRQLADHLTAIEVER
jgi:predicted Zn finger-like uncharacterized protein